MRQDLFAQHRDDRVVAPLQKPDVLNGNVRISNYSALILSKISHFTDLFGDRFPFS